MREDGHPEAGPARQRAARGLQADQETGHILPGDSLSLQHLQVTKRNHGEDRYPDDFIGF